MRQTDLPSLNRSVTNSLQLNRQIIRAIGQIEVTARRSQAVPASRDELVGLFQTAIDYLNAIGEDPVDPTDPTEPTEPTGPTDPTDPTEPTDGP